MLNIFVNGHGVDNAFGCNQRKQVQAKATIVEESMSRPKGENKLGPLAVFAHLSDCSGDSTPSIGFWSAVNVLQYDKEVNFTQSEGEDADTNCLVSCRCQPWEVLEEAGVVHWCGRLHGALLTMFGQDCHFVKLQPIMHIFWQFKVDEVAKLSCHLLAAPRLQAILAVPFHSL